MPSEKFPEAFERFEETVNVENIKSYDELQEAFASWCGRNWKNSYRQNLALGDEAKKRGIPLVNVRTAGRGRQSSGRPAERLVSGRQYYGERPYVKPQYITRRGKRQVIYRDSHGRFASGGYSRT